MTRDEVRQTLQGILTSHDEALAAIRQANEQLQASHRTDQRALEAHDAALVSAIEANRAAIALLNRMEQEGVS